MAIWRFENHHLRRSQTLECLGTVTMMVNMGVGVKLFFMMIIRWWIISVLIKPCSLGRHFPRIKPTLVETFSTRK